MSIPTRTGRRRAEVTAWIINQWRGRAFEEPRPVMLTATAVHRPLPRRLGIDRVDSRYGSASYRTGSLPGNDLQISRGRQPRAFHSNRSSP